MSSTAPSIFNFKRVIPMAAAARFGAFRNLFHHRKHSSDTMMSLRHASAMSTAILKNMSTPLGEPSQLVDPSTSFEDTHRHYSFITVLAIMSLFILITISIVALILGFCRKKNTVFALGGAHNKTAQSGEASQFELDDLDMDDTDVEMKASRDDPAGACYYHLSDNDDDDYDSDDDDDDYYQVNRSKKDDRKSKNEHSRKQRKKRKLRFRDSSYYYHLHNEDEDDSNDEYDFHESGWRKSNDNRQQRDNTTMSRTNGPKRSLTFPQLHDVLTSCIKGEPATNKPGLDYQRLFPSTSPSLPHSSEERQKSDKDTKPPTNTHTCIPTTSTTCCTNDTPNTEQSSSCDTQNTLHNQQNNPQLPVRKQDQPKLNGDSPALLHHESTHLVRVSKRSTKQPLFLHDKRGMKQSAFLPSKGKRRLFKSYSFHDIPRSRTKKAQIRYYPGHPSYLSGNSARPGLRQVTFKVGTLGVDTDIRVHHHV